MKKIVNIVSARFFIMLTLTGWIWPFAGQSQSPTPTYPSLLWEISGNGLGKPSYLFGSMHVSSKEVFHLSDSLYAAIAACEVVSLEVDPMQWQPDMFRLQEARLSLAQYSGITDGYLTENDFRLKGYENSLKTALREEPYIMNGLLYRTSGPLANFQEDTYLDLYIYQTGRRLGKIGTGVENYLQSERISAEANAAAMKEKRERKVLPQGENIFTLQNKLQDAYRRGDLSLLDSLNDLLSTSKVYTEKFLYQRNDIQAHSIDSILRHHSLFVAVGAAHLPGSRGVIESLRKMGYHLRPVTMTGDSPHSRDEIDQLHVPVESHPVITADGFITCRLPGPWFRRAESQNASWQYADMQNGSYYLLTRVSTNALLRGQDAMAVEKKIDSFLYDNIPGKILRKQAIDRNGYPGFDITNKTRDGDAQRYMIFITPSEVVLLKMSGKGEYVTGKEGDDFFSSIQLKAPVYQWASYTPSSGGFKAFFPQEPRISFPTRTLSSLTCQYEANTATGDVFLILKKNLGNSNFLEEDTLDLGLVGESLKGSDMLDHELSRKFGRLDGHDCLDMLFSTKTGGRLRARAIIRGREYYLLLASGKDEKGAQSKFFDGFHLAPYHYKAPSLYVDTVRHFSVRTPVRPSLPADLQFIADPATAIGVRQDKDTYPSATQTHSLRFQDDSTGEGVQVTVSDLPEYFYRKDSAIFWRNEMGWDRLKGDFIIEKKDYFSIGDSICGYKYTLLDTNTNRKLEGLAEVKGNSIFKLIAETDKLEEPSSFIKDFFISFTPLNPTNGYSMFQSKSALFFQRYHSKDSLTRKIAREALPHLLFEPRDLPELENSIGGLKANGKNYQESKIRLILALSRIQDTTQATPVIAYLKTIYDNSGDTSAFQNAVLEAVVRIRTKEARTLVRDWLVQKPPVFENAGEQRTLLHRLGEDSLKVSLFPDLLQLMPIEGYKTPLLLLMASLSDSGRLPAASYETYFPALFADAQVLLRRQHLTDGRQKEEEDEDETVRPSPNGLVMDNNFLLGNTNLEGRPSGATLGLGRYAQLLIPFYDRPSVPHFFDQLLQTRSLSLKMEITLLLIRNKKGVPDSILLSLAGDDLYRAKLYTQLDKAGRTDLFPAAYKNQEAMAKSLLVGNWHAGKKPTIEAMGKKRVVTKGGTGYVYFFKYKQKDQDGWLMAVSGIQPDNPVNVNTNGYLLDWSRQPLTTSTPEGEQFDKRLVQWVLSKRKSALRFYVTSSGFFLDPVMF